MEFFSHLLAIILGATITLCIATLVQHSYRSLKSLQSDRIARSKTPVIPPRMTVDELLAHEAGLDMLSQDPVYPGDSTEMLFRGHKDTKKLYDYITSKREHVARLKGLEGKIVLGKVKSPPDPEEASKVLPPMGEVDRARVLHAQSQANPEVYHQLGYDQLRNLSPEEQRNRLQREMERILSQNYNR